MTRYSSGSSRGSAVSRITPEVAVDPATNSLIVMAPLAAAGRDPEVDQQPGSGGRREPRRRLKIIALQKTNTARVEQALQRILKPGSPRAPRPSR